MADGGAHLIAPHHRAGVAEAGDRHAPAHQLRPRARSIAGEASASSSTPRASMPRNPGQSTPARGPAGACAERPTSDRQARTRGEKGCAHRPHPNRSGPAAAESVASFGRGAFQLGPALDQMNLLDSSHVPAACKRCLEERAQDVERQRRGRVARAQREDVQIVVLARQPRRRGVADRRRPHAGHFVRGDGHADPAAAHQDAAIESALADAPCHRRGEVRIVHRFGAVGAEVLVRDTQFVQCRLQGILQCHAGVVGAQGHSHEADSS